MNILSIAGQLILSLSILVVLHEFGHYLPAKWFKTRVEKFYLFFNPYFSLFKKKIGETEWGIGWIPFGGYVKISGMIDESMDKEQMEGPAQPWEFRSKPAWQRLIIMVGGVTVNFLLGFLIFGLILAYYGETYTKNADAKYGIIADSLGMQIGLQDGDKVLKVGDYDLDKFSPGQVNQEIIFNSAKTLTIQREGQQMVLNVPDDFVTKLTSSENKGASLFYARYPQEVAKVEEKSVAESAGIEVGDRIIGLDGKDVTYVHDFAREVKKHANDDITLEIRRGDEIINRTVTLDSSALIGVYSQPAEYFITQSREKYSLGQALPMGVKKGVGFLKNQLKAFKLMFKGKISAKDNLGSVLSIATLFDSSWNWEKFWLITASMSIILAFFNILPIPALDGGYVLFLLWEIISGKKPSDRFMEVVNIIGFILLITLMIFALGLDINRFF